MSEPAHSRVGGYRIIRKLAVGGMAEIFLARLEAAHGFTKEVVLKRLLPHLCEDPNFIDMFLYEARLAARLSHPNIGQVFDIGEIEGRVYYAMEYVHGADLRVVAKRIHARWDQPPLDLVIGVCIGVAAGLHYAHTARDEAGRGLAIVHRDVTPANVVVTYDGVAKLLDFGVAKAKLEGRESTAVGVLKGKLPYMSPEQIDCSVSLDGRSDVFSLGVVLWELTTLTRLYRCDSPMETIRRITGQDAPPPSSVCEGYPPALEAIVLRALARDREQRYENAFELQRALELFALEHRLVVSGSRIAELMAELFAEELEQEREAERAQLESDPREVTDSEVFTTNWVSDAELDVATVDEHDAPTGISEAGPKPGPVLVAAPAAADDLVHGMDDTAGVDSMGGMDTSLELDQPPRRRPWPWIGGAVGGAVLVALVWKLAGGKLAPEQPNTDPQPQNTSPSSVAAPGPEPVVSPELTPAATADPEDFAVRGKPSEDPKPATEDAADKPDKTENKRRTKKAPTKSDPNWNKNSLSLPD